MSDVPNESRIDRPGLPHFDWTVDEPASVFIGFEFNEFDGLAIARDTIAQEESPVPIAISHPENSLARESGNFAFCLEGPIQPNARRGAVPDDLIFQFGCTAYLGRLSEEDPLSHNVHGPLIDLFPFRDRDRSFLGTALGQNADGGSWFWQVRFQKDEFGRSEGGGQEEQGEGESEDHVGREVILCPGAGSIPIVGLGLGLGLGLGRRGDGFVSCGVRKRVSSDRYPGRAR